MADGTDIEWCDASWGITRGCQRVSPGCGGGTGHDGPQGGCYAERMAHRFSRPGKPFEGLTKLTKKGPRWTGVARFIPEMLDMPLRWKRPRKIFVSSMSDLFHSDITNEQIAAVFGIMGGCQRHTFQILTKRPERMKSWFDWIASKAGDMEFGLLHDACGQLSRIIDPGDHDIDAAPSRFDEAMEELMGVEWPLRNVWLGVSAEDQQRADERVPLLLQCPAAVHWVSAEPLLGPLDLRPFFAEPAVGIERGISWCVAGGESGPGSRACDIAWLESIVEQCRAAGVNAFVKQLGARPYMQRLPEWHEHERGGSWSVPLVMAEGRFNMKLQDKKGGDMAEFPPWLRVREMPEVSQ